MRHAVVLLVLAAACKRTPDESQQHAPAPAAPPAAANPLDAQAGPPELLPADGDRLEALPIPAFHAKLPATQLPPGLSARARAGVNLWAGDKNVAWLLDADWFAYDENANSDLRDDPHHAVAGGEVALTLHVVGAIAGSSIATPARVRIKDGQPYLQTATIRRGTLALPAGPMQFAVLGDRGRFGEDYELLAFDLDRDGQMDLVKLDAPGQFRVFEQAATLDGKSYAFQIDPAGDSLTLVPLAQQLPARPTLAPGSPAPGFAVTTFDDRHVALADLRGQVVLLDFWAVFCKPCIQSLPRLSDLRAKHHDHGFELVAIAMPSDDVKTVLGNHAAGIEAADEAVQTLYRIDRFPSYFLIAKDGTIACAHCTLDKIEEMLPGLL